MYRLRLLLSTTCGILQSILLLMSILYATEITEDKHCGFRLNRPTTDHIICIRQILQK